MSYQSFLLSYVGDVYQYLIVFCRLSVTIEDGQTRIKCLITFVYFVTQLSKKKETSSLVPLHENVEHSSQTLFQPHPGTESNLSPICTFRFALYLVHVKLGTLLHISRSIVLCVAPPVDRFTTFYLLYTGVVSVCSALKCDFILKQHWKKVSFV